MINLIDDAEQSIVTECEVRKEEIAEYVQAKNEVFGKLTDEEAIMFLANSYEKNDHLIKKYGLRTIKVGE